jgi:hypothetical protein
MRSALPLVTDILALRSPQAETVSFASRNKQYAVEGAVSAGHQGTQIVVLCTSVPVKNPRGKKLGKRASAMFNNF